MGNCRVVNIPGAPGVDGTDGSNGAPGANAFTLVSTGFPMPIVGGSILIEVDSTAWMVPQQGVVDGQYLAIEFAGTMLVIAVVDDTHVQVENIGVSGNAAPTSLIPVGARVGVSGAPGAAGSIPAGALLSANNLSDLSSIPTAQNTLGLKTMAYQDANNVAITGGGISGITPLALADGGTGAATAAGARSNLGITFGVADTNVPTVNDAGGLTNGELLRATATGVESVTNATVKTQLGIGAFPVVTKIASYAATINDGLILCDATAGPITIGLPAAATATGRELIIKKIDASANAVTIDGNLAETIDGAATKVIAAQWTAVDIVSDGSAWFIT